MMHGRVSAKNVLRIKKSCQVVHDSPARRRSKITSWMRKFRVLRLKFSDPIIIQLLLCPHYALDGLRSQPTDGRGL